MSLRAARRRKCCLSSPPAVLIGAVFAACLGIGACTTGSVKQSVTPLSVSAGQAANLISAYRAENGLPPVRVDSRLMQAAAEQARAMGERDKISHRIGGSLTKRVSRTGYDWGALSENLGAGYPSLSAVMEGWKRSPGHRKNLLSKNVTEIGIAAVATPPGSKRRNYWALVLGAPRPQRLQAGPFAMGLRQ